MRGVSILIPAYNEAERIGASVQALRQAGFEGDITVVDDGSGDDTADIASKQGARVIRLTENRGKGGAIMAGQAYLQSEIVLLLDADLQDSAGQALLLAEPVMTGQADMTIAVLPQGNSGRGFGLVKRMAQLGVRMMTGKRVKAPLSGQRCMKKSVLESLLPLAPGFGLEVGMTVDALKLGYRLFEVETALCHDPPGRDWRGFVHRGRQFCDVCAALWRRAGGKAHP
ncbi:MAG: glycosyltransferase family 2 protein [Clostridia bacterium]|jgi:glycosyltransferase involved in cell wall biosynthesis|nr:glycosyltransferase family 2 protein [Clostridia bacterium]